MYQTIQRIFADAEHGISFRHLDVILVLRDALYNFIQSLIPLLFVFPALIGNVGTAFGAIPRFYGLGDELLTTHLAFALMLIFTCLHSIRLYFVADFRLSYRGTNMVQIYNKNPRNKQIHQKVLKIK